MTGKDRPPWDEKRAQSLVGKRVLVGITNLAPDGETVIDQEQYYGVISWAHSEKGFRVDCSGLLAGTTKYLPPDLRAFRDARPGEYTLKSTGEVVVNPEVISTWYLTKSKN